MNYILLLFADQW